MKKTKLAIGLMTAMLTAGTLAGCDNVVKYSADGKIITYHEGDNSITVKADDLLGEYYKDSSKFQSIFDAINSIVIRNYFNHTEVITLKSGAQVKLGKEQMGQIELDAKKKVESDKKTAQTNASNNGTSYSDEFQSILSSKGAKDEDELKEKYIEELKKDTFDKNFYKYHVNEIKNGDEKVKYNGEKQLWNGYLNDMVPYHVSHILVKLEDGSGTNYANGTISEANAKKLFNVVDALVTGDDSFKTIAHRFSEDTGSAANYGDLGIMDYSTGYVNEFKLGIYAYENFLTQGDRKAAVLTSNINIPGNKADSVETGSIAESFLDVSKKAFGGDVPEIDYSAFVELNEYAKVDKDCNNKSVIDDSANFYPRNIVYNKHLNRHSVALVTTTDAALAHKENATTGFVLGSELGIPGLAADKYVLSVKTASGWTPILTVRAGSDYQGIHFIVVNRSKFVMTDNNGVSLDDYYTTYYPEQEDYPTDNTEAKNPLATYVNFSSSVTAETKSRAESLLSTMKSYDSERLNRYIFQKFFNDEGIKIKDDSLSQILSMWISRGLDKKEQEKGEAWEKTWNDYIDTLIKQNSERSKLVSQACKIAYLNGNGLKKDSETGAISKAELGTISDTNSLLYKMAKAMKDAGEVDSLEAAEKAIKSIRIGNTLLEDKISEVADLFKKEGALCNDGKEHI